MDNTTINNIPVEFGNSNEPIISVNFFGAEGPSFYSFDNFGKLSFDRSTVLDVIKEHLTNQPNTKRVNVSFWKP